MRIAWHDNLSRSDRLKDSDIFARGAMVARQVLTLKIEVRVLAGEPFLQRPCWNYGMRLIRSIIPVLLTSSVLGCARGNLDPASTMPSTVEVDVSNASAGAFTPDVEKRSAALHHFVIGQLSLNQQDFQGALDNFAKADQLNDEPAAIIHTKLADLYLRFGELDKALMAAKKAMTEDPIDPHVRLLYAGILESLGRDSEAEPIYRAIIEESPGKFDAYVLLSNLYMKQKNYEQALEILRRLIAKHPNEIVGYYYLGRVYEQMSKLDRAEEAYSKVVAADSALTNGATELLRVLLQQNKTEKAKALCEKILKKDPSNVLARKVLGHLMLGESKLDQALQHLTVLKELEADPSDTRFKVALIQIEKQNYKEAERELSLVIAKNPSHAEARYYLASIYAGSGKRKEAIEELLQITEDSPMYVKARTFAAFVLRQDEKLDQAREVIEDALTAEPGNKNLILYRVLLLRDLNEYEEAEQQLRSALETEPKEERFLFNLGLVLRDRGERAQANVIMEQVLVINPKNSEALNYVAYALAESGTELERAQGLIQRALEVSPTDGYYLDTLGWIQFKQGQLVLAEETLSKAINFSGEDLVIVEHYVEVLLAVGKQHKAVAFMKAIVEQSLEDQELLDPDSAQIYKRIKQKLHEILQQHPELQGIDKMQLSKPPIQREEYSSMGFDILQDM